MQLRAARPRSRLVRAAALAAVLVLGAPHTASAQAPTRAGTGFAEHSRRLGSGRPFQLQSGEALLALILLALAGALGIALLDRSSPARVGSSRRPRAPRAARKWTHVDVSVIRLALETPRPPGLSASVAAGELATIDAAALRALAFELRGAREHWSHVGGTSHKPMSAAMAEGLFELAASSAAGALAEGVGVRPAETASARYRTSAERNLSVLVLVVASREEIRDFDATSEVDVSATLSALERTGNDALVDAQVVWRRLPARPDVLGARALGLTAIARRR